MPTYPSFEQAEGTSRAPRSGIMLRTATNGASRARALTAFTRYDPVLVHLALTAAELAELYAFHEANRGAEFDLDYWGETGSTIACFFRDPPFSVSPFKTPSGIRYRVQVNLIQAD